jgi:predicted nucleic-acid-binding protein
MTPGNALSFRVNWFGCFEGLTYRFRKDEIFNVLEAMLHSAAFEFENRSTIDQALPQDQHYKADFSDYLIGAIARQAGCSETWSFDSKLKGERGFQCPE